MARIPSLRANWKDSIHEIRRARGFGELQEHKGDNLSVVAISAFPQVLFTTSECIRLVCVTPRADSCLAGGVLDNQDL